MTWRELKNLINKQARQNKAFLDTDVNLYDFKDGEEYSVGITELSCGDDELHDGCETNWITYLSINDKELEYDTETETQETSID